ncbi:50S ribosomal protein L20 [Mesoaciditoga lauensis]|uniref:50S ribosomal protein L20 n=1 Tax=Mesoaciditoga lauensis TaxID=1495039 RepID=UPI000564F7F6
MRIKRGTVKRRKHNKILKAAKGYRGARGTRYRLAKESTMRAGIYAYEGRKVKKRDMRSLWITRINIAARNAGLKYSDLIHGLNLAGVAINRKMLSDMAVSDPQMFDSYVEIAKKHLSAQ